MIRRTVQPATLMRPARERRSTPGPPALVLSARAWLKLQYLARLGDTEVGGFGISSAESPLSIEDVVTVGQTCTSISVVFDDEAVADFFDEQVDRGLKPDRFGRVWVHTHPGASAHPSGIDEETFARVFGGCDWSAMVILARGGQTYCRVRVRRGELVLEQVLPVMVDYESLHRGVVWDPQSWRAEYESHVVEAPEHWDCWGGELFDLGLEEFDPWEEVLDAD